jgi:hypothetical protein
MRRRAGGCAGGCAAAAGNRARALGFVRGARPFTDLSAIPMIVERLVNTKNIKPKRGRFPSGPALNEEGMQPR